jgi:hypothetical protein
MTDPMRDAADERRGADDLDEVPAVPATSALGRSVPPPVPPPVPALPDPAAGVRELRLVQRRELAELLLEAASIRCRRAPFHGVHARLPLPVPLLDVWRRRTRRVLWRHGHDGPGQVDGGAQLLADLLERASSAWPDALALALASRRLVDGGRARLVQGYAHLGHGESQRAIEVFAGLVRAFTVAEGAVAPALRWQAYDGLAAAHEERGHDRLALGAAEMAAEQPGCGASAMVRALFLALSIGDRERALRAVARLDLLAAPGSLEFGRAVASLRTRVDVLRGGLPFEPPRATRWLFRSMAGGGDSPAERVCKALSGEPKSF